MATISGSTVSNSEFIPTAVGAFRIYNTGSVDIILWSASAAGGSFARVQDSIKAGTVVEINNLTTTTAYKWTSLGSGATALADQ